MSRIAVLGAGAWGTALALAAHAAGQAAGQAAAQSDAQAAGQAAPGNSVTLWTHRPEHALAMAATRRNERYLPAIELPAALVVTSDARAALEGAEIVICAVPSQFLRSVMTQLGAHLDNHLSGETGGPILVSATKGIEDGTGLRMTEVMEQAIAGSKPAAASKPAASSLHFAALSGPSFALEVAQQQPTAVTIAAREPATAAAVSAALTSGFLRLYTTDDLIGVELGGALKNVIAIAAGLATGLGLGHNSTAGLITRGIAEMTRLAVAAGARRETLAGLSGLGDLVLTCTGSLSRNRSVGVALGRGRSLDAILAELDGKVAEGVRTTHAAMGLARRFGVEMPITAEMEQILFAGKDPRLALRQLMQRPGREELG